MSTPDPVAAPLTILLDEQAQALPGPCTLAELVERLGHAPPAVATAVNGRFVARSARAGTALADGDRVSLFQPIVGG
ncbi:MAG: hypothetical protein RIQ53_1584 [Pseudomonadota bacterium]|jgi:sulfur carrier protein